MFMLKKTHTEHVNALQSTITHLRAEASKNNEEFKAQANNLRKALNEIDGLKFQLANASALIKCHEQTLAGIKKLMDLATRGDTKIELEELS